MSKMLLAVTALPLLFSRDTFCGSLRLDLMIDLAKTRRQWIVSDCFKGKPTGKSTGNHSFYHQIEGLSCKCSHHPIV